MKENLIAKKSWLFFILLAVIFFIVWLKLGYPQFKVVDLIVDKNQAVDISKNYLNKLGFDVSKYQTAVVFESDQYSDVFLQKVLGSSQVEKFSNLHDLQLFTWKVRFFKSLQKEEFLLWINPKTGQIIIYNHLIEDIEKRLTLDKALAKQKAEDFLKNNFGFDFVNYDFNEESAQKVENRTDYLFSWEKKGINLNWNNGQGQAKFLTKVIISGEEVRYFSKVGLDIPEKFNRYIDKQFAQGAFLSRIIYILFVGLLVVAISVVLKNKFSLDMRICKRKFIVFACFLGVLQVLASWNNIENVFMNYRTTDSFMSFMGQYFVGAIIIVLFVSVVGVIPAIAGEFLFAREFPERKNYSLLHYFKSSFFTQQAAKNIILGYLLFIIFLGFQSLIFSFGHKYLGVWKQTISLTEHSSAYIPFFAAFVMAIIASFNEEIIFRVFGISWLKNITKNVFLAILISSLIWGFGHTNYAIFPVWFRGIEVTLLGIFFGFIFIRYGVVSLLVAHYLVDIFWGASAFILGKSPAYIAIGTWFILLLPLFFAFLAWVLNKPDKEKRIELQLDKIQKYNIEMLKIFLNQKISQGVASDQLYKELLEHGWDHSLVDIVFEELRIKNA